MRNFALKLNTTMSVIVGLVAGIPVYLLCAWLFKFIFQPKIADTLSIVAWGAACFKWVAWVDKVQKEERNK